MSGRVGLGFDAHRLVAGRRLMLGGVAIDHDRGLLGHSDGDCVLHALCDALLGALAAGDMGAHFPNSDPKWKDAPSQRFVDGVMAKVGEAGGRVRNVDVTIIAEEPRLFAHLPAIRGSVATALGLDLARVSVKAKSTDGLGAVGRGEGIAAQAVVLVDLPE